MNKIFVIFIFWALTTVAFAAAPDAEVQRPASVAKKELGRQEITYKQDEPVTTAVVMRVLLSLVFVLLLTAAAVYLLKRYLPGWRVTGPGRSSRISVIEARRLTPKTMLFLIEVEGKTLLVAQSADGLTKLAEFGKLISDPTSPA